MHPFREKTPKHREDRKVCKHFTSYRKTLRADFGNRCGYCNDPDILRIRSYTIDHFVPQTPDGWINSIPSNEYKNLIYSCSFCNRSKENKWPTKDEKKHNDGSVGFIKPTLVKYGRIFKRDKDGSITLRAPDNLANYIYNELSLWHSIHSLNWKIEKFMAQEKLLEKIEKKSKDPIIQAQIVEIKRMRLELFDSRNQILNGQ